MKMAVNDYTPPRAAANSARAITLDLRAINNAAADIHECRTIAARLAQETFEHVAPDDLIRCRVMLAEVERTLAREGQS
jgi:hypothetical protein